MQNNKIIEQSLTLYAISSCVFRDILMTENYYQRISEGKWKGTLNVCTGLVQWEKWLLLLINSNFTYKYPK